MQIPKNIRNRIIHKNISPTDHLISRILIQYRFQLIKYLDEFIRIPCSILLKYHQIAYNLFSD